MLEQYFKAQYALVQARPGIAGPFLEGFAGHLETEGFTPSTVGRYLRAAAHLGAWMEAEGIALPDLDDTVIGGFIQHLASCACVKARGHHSVRNRPARAGVWKFIAHLRHQDVVPPSPPSDVDLPDLVEAFQHWMLVHRGAAASTVAQYRPTIIGLLKETGGLGQFTIDGLRRFVAERTVQFGPEHGKEILSKVRMFLRFLAGQGQCDPLLVDAIPPIAHWRLASLPAYLAPGEVERIVGAPDIAKPVGLRNRAILLLLARLGLRAGDVIHLRLDDIDWPAGTIAINGKERRPGRLPLPQEVGNAILDYLSGGRPRTNARQVFVRVRPPHGPLLNSSSISDIVAFAAKHAGVVLPPASSVWSTLMTSSMRRAMSWAKRVPMEQPASSCTGSDETVRSAIAYLGVSRSSDGSCGRRRARP
jgi:integrase/recombinase XerD